MDLDNIMFSVLITGLLLITSDFLTVSIVKFIERKRNERKNKLPVSGDNGKE